MEKIDQIPETVEGCDRVVRRDNLDLMNNEESRGTQSYRKKYEII